MRNKTIYSLFFLFFIFGLIVGGSFNDINNRKIRKKLNEDLSICDKTYGKETIDYFNKVWNPSIQKINSSKPETLLSSLNLSKVYIEKASSYFNCINNAYGWDNEK